MEVRSSRMTILALFALAMGVSGCASAGGGGGGGGSRNMIVRSELAAITDDIDARQAVERLRSLWMSGAQPVVYVDGARTTLDRYQADEVESMEYLDPQQAEIRFGAGHDGGAILVTTLIAGGGGTDLAALLGGTTLEQGENPRNSDNTEAAADALDAGDDADSPAEAQGHYQRALAAAEAEIAADPTNPLGHRLAALAALSLEQYQVAGEHFDRASALRPVYEFEDQSIREQVFIERYQAASPFLDSGDYEQATEVLEDAHSIFSSRPEAMVLLAQLYAQLGQHDQALEKVRETQAFLVSERMAEVDEETAAQWRAQAENFPLLNAQILADAQRYDEAAVAYRDLIAQNPDDMALQQDLAAILMQAERTEEALDVYRELVQRPGLTADDLTRIGLSFYQAEEYGEAAGALEQATEASSTDRDAYEWWARALVADSAFAEVPDVADAWLELDPNSQAAYALLATAANQSGQTQRAAAAVNAVQALEFSVNDLQMRRIQGGGAQVSGAVANRTLAQGDQVTLVFTFYGSDGSAVGTVSQEVTLGAEGMNQVFQVLFDSTEAVDGYGYEVGG